MGRKKLILKILLKDGFSRAYIDGELTRLDEAKRLDRYFNHDISVVVDRVKIKKTGGRRLPQSIETALELTSGLVDISFNKKIYSYRTKKTLSLLSPPSFSLSSFEGMRVSLYPLGSVKVQSKGLKWSTEGLIMKPTAQIGTSNEAVGKIIHLAPDEPKLLLILPKSLLNDAVFQLGLAPSW